MDENSSPTTSGYTALSWPCLTFFVSTNCRTKAEAVLRRLSIGGSKGSLASSTVDKDINPDPGWEQSYSSLKERSYSFDSEVAGSANSSCYGGGMRPIHVVTSEPTLQQCMAEIHNAIPSCHSDPEQDSDMYYDFGIMTPEDGLRSGSSVISRITVERTDLENQECKSVDKPESGCGTSATSPTPGTIDDGLLSNPPSPNESPDSQKTSEVKLEEVRNLLTQTKLMEFGAVPWVRTFRCPNHYVHYSVAPRCFRKRNGSKNSVESTRDKHDACAHDDIHLMKKSKRKRKKHKKGHGNSEYVDSSPDSSPTEEFGVYYPLQAEHGTDSDVPYEDELSSKTKKDTYKKTSNQTCFPNKEEFLCNDENPSSELTPSELLNECCSETNESSQETGYSVKPFANMSSSDRSPLIGSKRKEKKKPIKTYGYYITSKNLMKDMTYVDIDINDGYNSQPGRSEEVEQSCAFEESHIPRDLSCESPVASALYQMSSELENYSNTLGQGNQIANSLDAARSEQCSLLNVSGTCQSVGLTVSSTSESDFNPYSEDIYSACVDSVFLSENSVAQKLQEMPDFEGQSKVESVEEECHKTSPKKLSSSSNHSPKCPKGLSETSVCNVDTDDRCEDRLPRVKRRKPNSRKSPNSQCSTEFFNISDKVNTPKISECSLDDAVAALDNMKLSDFASNPETLENKNLETINGDGSHEYLENMQTNNIPTENSHDDTIECLATEGPSVNGVASEDQERICVLDDVIETNCSSPDGATSDKDSNESQNKNLAEELERLEVSEGGTKEGMTDDEENDTQTRVKRSSSLKCGKTPPGAPGRKKAVRFVDALGLDLVDVRTYLDGVPNVPKSAYCDLDLTEAETQAQAIQQSHSQYLPPKRIISPMFQQPGSLPDFLDRVRSQKVCLENIEIDPDLTVKGMIRVLNLDYHKRINVRYTYDNWKSFHETVGTYINGTSDGFSDKFYFFLLGSFLQSNGVLTFCIKYTTKGQEFWDNNRGVNYILQCYPAPPTTNPSMNVAPNRAQNDTNIQHRHQKLTDHSVFTNGPATPTDPWAVRFF